MSDQQRRQHLHRLYRRAVVLHAELRGAAMVRPATYLDGEQERYEALGADLAHVGIRLDAGAMTLPHSQGSLVDLPMIVALEHAMGDMQDQLCPGQLGMWITTVGAFSP